MESCYSFGWILSSFVYQEILRYQRDSLLSTVWPEILPFESELGMSFMFQEKSENRNIAMCCRHIVWIPDIKIGMSSETRKWGGWGRTSTWVSGENQRNKMPRCTTAGISLKSNGVVTCSNRLAAILFRQVAA